MSKKGNGFFGKLLLFMRLIFTTVLTLAVFVLLLGFVAFRCMHPAGSHMLASMLSAYPVVEYLPRIFYSPSELDRILEEQSAVKEEDGKTALSQTDSEANAGMLLCENAASDNIEVETDDSLIHLDGLYVINNPAPTEAPVSAPSQSTQPEEAVPTVLYGCVNGNITTYLRLSPSLDAKKVHTIEPGTWCTVIEEEKQFYKIDYENTEYYIYKDRLDVYEVPELNEGLTVGGLDEATEEEISQALSKEEQGENANKIMCGYVKGITPYRNLPSFTAPQVGFLEADTHFRILEEVDSFYKISLDGSECFVNKTKTIVYYEDLPASNEGDAPAQEANPAQPEV